MRSSLREFARLAVRTGLAAVLLSLLAACAAPTAAPLPTATFVPPTLTATTAPTNTAVSAAAPPTFTPAPSDTPVSAATPTAAGPQTPTPIPGFEDWSVFQPSAVDIAVDDGALVLTLKRRALWFNQEQGVLVYQPVTGNFRVTAVVSATRASSPGRPPGGDGTVQLGGLMARAGVPGRENYVFIVVGSDATGLAVETKTTVDSVSAWEGPNWPAPAAELRLCRVGQTFFLYKRAVDSGENWTLAQTIDRPDLPETLQVGANLYTDSRPDLQVRFDHLRIEPAETESDCTTD